VTFQRGARVITDVWRPAQSHPPSDINSSDGRLKAEG